MQHAVNNSEVSVPVAHKVAQQRRR